MKLPSVYNPAEYESDIYSLWEQGRAFEPKNRGNPGVFSIVAPPPNANADLHIGYALVVAIEDTLVRYQRMTGKETLFVPGADHAGFETWVVYEKKLNEKGKSRFDYSREELYRQVWSFVQDNKHNFESQLRKLGASYDWSRFTFTLDPKGVSRAYKTFQKMWQEGLIYRGKRIVNYCTFHGTSFSDIEVIHEEEKTKLWHIAYPLADGEGEVVIATTRPETKLGQSALMVNPKDKRYKHLIGQKVLQPLVPNKPIEIIADDYVDMDFGTGVVTVTPGHDQNDFEVAQRHNLPIIELITTEGKISDKVPKEFRRLTIADAREAVVKKLQELGYLREIKDYVHSVGKCYKCGTIIEPLVREQWFVKMKPLAQAAAKELKSGQIAFYPASKLKQTLSYLEEVRDWNISRQIPWGIPIPAFQNVKRSSDWIFDARVDQEFIEKNGKRYRRDPDVFDTWFSSGQWPYVTLDYPGSDFKKFYPLSLMETGGEILYQWVARMIMLGLYTTGKVPFKDVYIHGYVLAEGGAKMSKSLGNAINPQTIISEYGSDALRMGLLSGRRPGVNQGFHTPKVKGGRNFANKLWNVARFVEATGTKSEQIKLAGPADQWIASRLNQAGREIAESLEAYRLSEAYEALYGFVWRDFADWYVEASKTEVNPDFLNKLLAETLKLAHPFAPFVTEAIWQTMNPVGNSLLATQEWPEPLVFDKKQAVIFEDLMAVAKETRHIISALKVRRPVLYFSDSKTVAANGDLLVHLGHLGELKSAPASGGKGLRLATPKGRYWLDVEESKLATYVGQLKLQEAQITDVVKLLKSRLANKSYAAKAPKALVEQSRSQLVEQTEKLVAVHAEIKAFASYAEG